MPELGYIISLFLGVCVAIVLLLPKKKNSRAAKPSSTFDGEKPIKMNAEDASESSISSECKCERELDKSKKP